MLPILGAALLIGGAAIAASREKTSDTPPKPDDKKSDATGDADKLAALNVKLDEERNRAAALDTENRELSLKVARLEGAQQASRRKD